MPQCPNCREEIDALTEVVCQYRDNRVWLGENANHLEFNEEDSELRDEEVVHYECPYCKEIVCESYSKALDFLNQ